MSKRSESGFKSAKWCQRCAPRHTLGKHGRYSLQIFQLPNQPVIIYQWSAILIGMGAPNFQRGPALANDVIATLYVTEQVEITMTDLIEP